MLYKNDIANMALGRLGTSKTISDIEVDTTVEARVMRRNFRFSLDHLLEQHQWNFARKTQILTVQFNNPEYGYKYSYYMPADCLQIRQIAEDGMFINNLELYPEQKLKFTEVIKGTTRLIYSNVPNAHIEYTQQFPENGVFPSHFGRGLAAQLSKDVAPSLITSNFPKVKQALNDDADNDIAGSIADDLARQPQFTNTQSSFIRARY